MINLNDDSFDGSKTVSIFNNGNAGVVENVTISVNKKTAEDKENAPDYKLIFTDKEGATTNTAFWYIDKATEYATVEAQIKKQGKVLRHVAKTIYGSDYNFPEYPNAAAMLDGIMKLIKEGVSGNTYRVFANYGSTMSIKAYIQVRSWAPFMEATSVLAEDTSLKLQNIDAMVRLTEDAPVPVGVTADAGDDW